jgi:hypothetical protein
MRPNPSLARGAAALLLVLTIEPQAFAEVFKCKGPGGVTYQAQPCGSDGERIELPVHVPSEHDRARSRTHLERAQRLVGEYEAEREHARREADHDRVQKSKERAALDARCAAYKAEIARGRKSGKGGSGTSSARAERIREAEARHFSECFGRR